MTSILIPQYVPIMVFAIGYVVWGSTNFIIQVAVKHFQPMILDALHSLTAGILFLGWCLINGERTGMWSQIKPAIIS